MGMVHAHRMSLQDRTPFKKGRCLNGLSAIMIVGFMVWLKELHLAMARQVKYDQAPAHHADYY